MSGLHAGLDSFAHMRCRFRKWYFRKKYAGKPPKIYYDRRYRAYVSPARPDEYGDILWVCSELAEAGLIYHYRLGEYETHAHGFEAVLRAAYEYGETFSIPEEHQEQYSAQELAFLESLARRGVRDREASAGNARFGGRRE